MQRSCLFVALSSVVLSACGGPAGAPVAVRGSSPVVVAGATGPVARPVRLLTPAVAPEREFNNYYSGEIDTWLLRAVGYEDLLEGKWGRARFRVEESFYDEAGGTVGGHPVRLRVQNDWTLSGTSRGEAVTGRFDGKWGAEASAHGRTVYLERFGNIIEGRTGIHGRFIVQTTLVPHDIQLLGLLAVLLAGDPASYGTM
jgi:hypothetical protein